MFVLGMGILDLLLRWYSQSWKWQRAKALICLALLLIWRAKGTWKKSPQSRKRNMVHEYCFLFYKDHEQNETSVLILMGFMLAFRCNSKWFIAALLSIKPRKIFLQKVSCHKDPRLLIIVSLTSESLARSVLNFWSHRIHGTGNFIYIYHQSTSNTPNVGIRIYIYICYAWILWVWTYSMFFVVQNALAYPELTKMLRSGWRE